MKRPEGFDRPVEPEPQRKEKPSARAAKSRGSERRADAPVEPREPRSTRDPRAPKQPRGVRSSVASGPTTDHRSTEREVGSTARTQAKSDARALRKTEKHEARRFTRHTRRRRYTLVAVIGVFAAMVIILAVAIFSPLLALRTIQVDGTSKVSSTAVRNAVSNQLGTPLALLNEGKIHADLAQFTLIRSYSTALIPPNTLAIHVIERQPIGVIQNGKKYDQVDAAGVTLATSTTPPALPVIDIGNAKPGSAAFVAAVRVLLAMPSSVSHLVQTVSARTVDDVSLTLTGATNTVIWGSSSDSDLKARVLAQLMAQPVCKSQAVIDVSAPLVAGCGPVHVLPTATPTPTPKPTATSR